MERKFQLIISLENPKNWRETNLYLTYIGFYKASKYFMDRGIIVAETINGKRVYKLTDKGKKLLYHIKQIYKILGEYND